MSRNAVRELFEILGLPAGYWFIQVLTFSRDNGLLMKPFMDELYAVRTFLSHNNTWRIIPFGDIF
jgi:hypothetical protein